ncbi:Nuclear transport factor 2 (NTF2) family protein [Striga hermonthica]|uniref:Nuclear transport factor 2 (NTF2) family protein n=1 Tax=Striga hermonthica TaxID=68872 RepID=A0A9N7NTL5_STRHE|nr:Nuclear transport factor 2 (NTF2) family protein [Striga hermonthica]
MDNPTANTATVRSLYDAVSRGGRRTISGLVSGELEWWFHGPHNCHHMMKMLTGESSPSSDFKFEPRSIVAVDGERVIAEGWEGDHVYWVHVWTVDKQECVITQFREYFNTWLTVADFKPNCLVSSAAGPTLWQSHPRDVAKRSLPGLMLAI